MYFYVFAWEDGMQMQVFVCICEHLQGDEYRFVPMSLCLFMLIFTYVYACTRAWPCSHICNYMYNLIIIGVPYQHDILVKKT